MVVVMMNVVCNIELKTRPMGIGPVDDIYVASYSELNEESPGYVDYGEEGGIYLARHTPRYGCPSAEINMWRKPVLYRMEFRSPSIT